MELYNGPLAQLRLTHLLLNHDLADLDLADLRRRTAESEVTGALDAQTVEMWVRVLEGVSQPLVRLRREVNRVESYVKTRSKSLKLMMAVVIMLLITVVLVTAITLYKTFRSLRHNMRQLFLTFGVLLGAGTVFLGMMHLWIKALVSKQDSLKKLENSPLASILSKYSDTMGNLFIVRYASAVHTGSGMRTLLKELKAGDSNQVDQYYQEEDRPKQNSRGCDANKARASKATDCRFPVDSCLPLDQLPSIEQGVRLYCKDLLRDLSDRLIEVKADVDQWDRTALWRCVNTHIHAVRRMVMAQYDVASSGGAALGGGAPTRKRWLAIVKDEVLPLLCLPVVELTDAFDAPVLDDAKWGGAGAGGGQVMASKQDCWRACVDQGQCRLATYDPATRTCRRAQSYEPLEDFQFLGDRARAEAMGAIAPAVGVTIDGKRPPANPHRALLLKRPQALVHADSAAPDDDQAALFVCGMARNPPGLAAPLRGVPEGRGGDNREWCRARKDCHALVDDKAWRVEPGRRFDHFFVSDGDSGGGSGKGLPLQRYCVKTSAEAVFQSVAPQALVTTLRNQSRAIVRALLTVVERAHYQINLDSVRPRIDAGLRAYYGEDRYDDAMREVVDRILREVRESVDVALQASGGSAKYVTFARFSEKLASLSAPDWDDTRAEIDRLAGCARLHRDHFPSMMSEDRGKVVKTLFHYSCVCATIGQAIILLVLWINFRDMKITGAKLLQSALIMVCVFTIALSVGGNMESRLRTRLEHNNKATGHNGDMLVSAIQRLQRDMGDLRAALERPSATADPAPAALAARRAMNSSRAVLESFERCNFITHGHPKPIFQTVDLFLYVIIIAMFVIIAIVALTKLEPGVKYANMRAVIRMMARMRNGDVTNMGEVVRLIDCCHPPDVVWSVFVWFAVVLLFMATVWFVQNNISTANNYRTSLANQEDCTDAV